MLVVSNYISMGYAEVSGLLAWFWTVWFCASILFFTFFPHHRNLFFGVDANFPGGIAERTGESWNESGGTDALRYIPVIIYLLVCGCFYFIF